MITVVSIILTAVAFIIIVFPFFRQKQAAMELSEKDRLKELRSGRDTTYSMLKELDFDYQSGMLDSDDYRELESRYKKKAISILKEMDEQSSPQSRDVGTEIEKEVKALRQGAGKGQGQGQGQGPFCAQCGKKARPEDRFCSSCGAAVGRGKNAR